MQHMYKCDYYTICLIIAILYTLCTRYPFINFLKVFLCIMYYLFIKVWFLYWRSMHSTHTCRNVIFYIIWLIIFFYNVKVDIEESPTIANVENVRIVPTVKIYKKGNRMKELVCPSKEVLESSVRHYSF